MATVELKGSEWKNFAKEHEYAVIDCYGDHCFACVMLEPVLEGVSDELAGISFARINISQYPEIGEAHHVTALPTVLFFRKGEYVGEFIGSLDRAGILQELSKLLYA